jgi:biopolymer transport protein ExbB
MPSRTRSLTRLALPVLLLIAHTTLAQTAAPATPATETPAAAVAIETPSATVAPETPAAPAETQAPAPTTAEVANPYGLTALWAGGDFIVHFTLIALVIMSMATWYVLVTKFVEQSRLHASARAAAQRFWQTGSVAEGLSQLKPGSAFHYLAEQASNAARQYEGALAERIDMHAWLSLAIDRASAEISNRLTRGLAVLATVGSTGPFIGLFGTVWGFYHALTAIGIAGQASIDKVAGPVGEALIMTAIGLAVAVPAVLGYNFLVRRNKVAMESVRRFGGELHTVLLGGKRAGQ